MDRGAWRATSLGSPKSQTGLRGQTAATTAQFTLPVIDGFLLALSANSPHILLVSLKFNVTQS